MPRGLISGAMRHLETCLSEPATFGGVRLHEARPRRVAGSSPVLSSRADKSCDASFDLGGSPRNCPNLVNEHADELRVELRAHVSIEFGKGLFD